MMSKEITLNFKSRAASGNGPARRCRRDGLIPAVIYGHGETGRNIEICAREYRPICHKDIQLITLKCEKENILALQKEVQFDFMKDQVIHIDFQEVNLNEIIQSTVSIHSVGVPAGVSQGGLLDQVTHSLKIACEAGNIPSGITVDISGLDVGQSITVAQLEMPKGVKALTDLATPVFTLFAPAAEVSTAASTEAAVATTATPAAPAAKAKKK